MAYAVIRTGGKQFCVSPGDRLKIPSISGEVGSDIKFDDVLAVTGESLKLDKQSLNGASVLGKIVAHGRDKKLIVFKFKRRKRYKRKKGHRQSFTQVEIQSIGVG
jgi:large subunit ribosomal protein L21